MFFNTGDIKEDIDDCLDTLENNHKDFVEWNALGLLFKNRYDNYSDKTTFEAETDLKTFIECFTMALKFKLNYKEAWYNLVGSFEENNDYETAIERYNMALDIKFNSLKLSRMLFSKLGDVCKKQEKYDKKNKKVLN